MKNQIINETENPLKSENFHSLQKTSACPLFSPKIVVQEKIKILPMNLAEIFGER